MDQIGVRELRQNASVYLERVKKGESIEVTERGVPIAVLSPAAKATTIEQLIAEGRATPPRGSMREWLDANPPAEPLTDGPTLSEVLQQMRDDDYR